MALKGLIGLTEDESIFIATLDGPKRFESLVRVLSQNLMTLEEDNISYHLQLESVQLLIVVLSSPLYGRASKLFDRMLANLTDLAPKLSQKLLEKYTNKTEGPADIYEPGNTKGNSGSVVLSIASGLWNILTFGYSNVAALPPSGNADLDTELWSKKPLSDLSALLLLLLINHSSSNSNELPDHCYRLALYRCYSHKGKFSKKVAKLLWEK